MDPTFPSSYTGENTPLCKRRRFAPYSELSVISSCDNSAIENQTFDSPLLLQLSGRTPTPQEIEAELLQVGMRVRKSVNDGYKTTAFTPRPFFNMRRLSPETQAALCSGPVNRQPTSTATFCGINLAALAHISTTPVEEQRMWSYSTSHKRGYEGDSDSDDQEFMPHTPRLGSDEGDVVAIPMDYFNIDFDGADDVSPMTQIGSSTASHMHGRRVAKPRSKRQQRFISQPQISYNPFGQLQSSQTSDANPHSTHKRMTSCGVEANMSLTDFNEAGFLQRREDIDMDCS